MSEQLNLFSISPIRERVNGGAYQGGRLFLSRTLQSAHSSRAGVLHLPKRHGRREEIPAEISNLLRTAGSPRLRTERWPCRSTVCAVRAIENYCSPHNLLLNLTGASQCWGRLQGHDRSDKAIAFSPVWYRIHTPPTRIFWPLRAEKILDAKGSAYRSRRAGQNPGRVP